MTGRPIAYDFGLDSSFRTREDPVSRLPHPGHQAMAAIAKDVSDRVNCDYEYQT